MLLDPFAAWGQGPIILDGGLATELERRGADLRDPLWSARVLLDRPDLIRDVHLDYFRAGADVAITASYQASLPGLMRRGLSAAEARAVLESSAQVACDARDLFCAPLPAGRKRPLIAASVGCYGAFLHDGSEYRGDYGLSVQELLDWHAPRLDILAGSGTDLLACETVPSLPEAQALAQLLEARPGVAAWVSFTCRDSEHLRDGSSFADAVTVVSGLANVVAVGVNCTAPGLVLGLLGRARPLARQPLLAYPNSGETWDPADRNWQRVGDVFDWGEASRRWFAAGARLIGGCCRTTPDTIRCLAGALRRE